MSNHLQMPVATRILRSSVLPFLAVTLTINAVGCSGLSCYQSALAPYESLRCECFTRIRARLKARQIWRAKYQHCYGGRGFASDIRQGFIDGFVDTTLGGSGCPPLIPPQTYCGKNKAASPCWYEGFPLGAAAAESCGAVNWCKTPLSPELAACLAQSSCSPGCVPCEACEDCGTPTTPSSIPVVPEYNLPEYSDPPMDDDSAVFQQHVGDDIAPETPGSSDAGLPTFEPLELQEGAPVPTPEPLVPTPETLELPGVQSSDGRAGDLTTDTTDTTDAGDAVDDRPVVDGPVPMPNLQVGYDADLLDVFRDIDVAQAMLYQQLPNASVGQ